MRLSPDQLALAVPDVTADPTAELDLEHADRVLAADLAAAPPAPTCRCWPDGLPVRDEFGGESCWLCGRPSR